MKTRVYVIHKPTGAKIEIDPKFVGKQDLPIGKIEKKHDRRCYTLHKLSDRWDYDFEIIMKLLADYEIPVMSFNAPIYKDGSIDVDRIMIFDEYVFALEKKLKIPHNKLKSKLLILPKDH